MLTRWRDGEMKLGVMGMIGNHSNGWVLFHYLLNNLQNEVLVNQCLTYLPRTGKEFVSVEGN